MSEPLTIRIKDLKPGDKFICQGARYQVADIRSKIWVMFLGSKNKKSFPRMCQAKVEIIQT